MLVSWYQDVGVLNQLPGYEHLHWSLLQVQHLQCFCLVLSISVSYSIIRKVILVPLVMRSRGVKVIMASFLDMDMATEKGCKLKRDYKISAKLAESGLGFFQNGQFSICH